MGNNQRILPCLVAGPDCSSVARQNPSLQEAEEIIRQKALERK